MLRKSGYEYYLPLGLIARAKYSHFETLLDTSTKKQALQDLQETHEIAQRGGMKLHLTDYHLEACRLAITIDANVHELTAVEHLAKAKALVEEAGYHRSDGEVTYLEGLLSG